MSGDDSVTLPPGLHAPAHARAWLADHADAIPRELFDDALLVTTRQHSQDVGKIVKHLDERKAHKLL